MKKNVLFIINNLNCGGAEKALINLLEMIDYSLYNVDLFLLKHEGIFLNKVPKQVNLLDEPVEYKYFNMPIKKAIAECLMKGQLTIALSRLRMGYVFRTEKDRGICDQKSWRYIAKSLKDIKKRYDVAIGFLEKAPIYFCIDKVNSSRKIGFIHNDYYKLGLDFNLDLTYFGSLDSIFTVSEECAKALKNQFPMFEKKVKVMHNIVSPNVIRGMAEEHIDLEFEGVNLVSVGRLNYQKGFDLAVKACKQIVDHGYAIKWFIIGEGEERINLERLIEEYGLKDNFILLGIKENPYSYIKQSDIYVQTSRFEGKSIAIDEAKILSKPIVVTNFSTVRDQIQNEKTGLVVEMAPECIANGIERLINDKKLSRFLIGNLCKEEFENGNEVLKLYECFGK